LTFRVTIDALPNVTANRTIGSNMPAVCLYVCLPSKKTVASFINFSLNWLFLCVFRYLNLSLQYFLSMSIVGFFYTVLFIDLSHRLEISVII